MWYARDELIIGDAFYSRRTTEQSRARTSSKEVSWDIEELILVMDTSLKSSLIQD